MKCAYFTPAIVVMVTVGVSTSVRAQRGDGSFIEEHEAGTSVAFSDAQIKALESASYEAARLSNTPFYTPPLIRPAGGMLSTELTVRYAKNKIGSDDVELRSYNGCLQGPTLLLAPGDTLEVRVRNELPPQVDRSRPDHVNVTNLHTHGLQVSPEDNSDNVFLAVKPGATYDFSFKIPGWHLPGTHWYHAHSHGSTAVQLSSGMAGALLLKGGLDDVPAIRQADDLLFLFQQFPYDDQGRIERTEQITNWRRLQQDAGRETTINGQVHPVLNMAPDEVQRWRFIHAGIADRLELVIKDANDNPVMVEMHEIAADGIPLGRLRTTTQIDLGPGYRSDVLVKAPSSGGPFYLVDMRSDATRSFRRDRPDVDRALMRIELTGAPMAMELPNNSDLENVPRPEPIEDVPHDKSQSIVFAGGDDPRDPATINGKEFEANVTNIVTQVGAVEEWTLSTDSTPPVNAPHPFHIHVNPFWAPLTDPATNEQYYAWKDTLLVGPTEQVKVKMRFHKCLPGKTVLHCHRLDHEDNGMMVVVRINDNEPDDGPCTEEAVAINKQAPPWKLKGLDGVTYSNAEFLSTPLLLVFFRGFDCPHCVGQISLLRKREGELSTSGVKVVLVSSSDADEVQMTLQDYKEPPPFLVLPDPGLSVFRVFGCSDSTRSEPQHGVFAIDSDGRLRWRHISEEALLDVEQILSACSAMSRD